MVASKQIPKTPAEIQHVLIAVLPPPFIEFNKFLSIALRVVFLFVAVFIVLIFLGLYYFLLLRQMYGKNSPGANQSALNYESLILNFLIVLSIENEHL